MTPIVTEVEQNGFLDLKELAKLCHLPGPWVTMLLPGYRPGAQGASNVVRLKHLLTSARELVKQLPAGSDGDAILAPLEALPSQPFAESGGAPCAVFSSSGHFAFLRLDAPPADGFETEERLALGSYPLIKPLLESVMVPSDFFILELSRKNLRLLRYFRGSCEEVPLPTGMPRGVEEAGGFDAPDHMLVNRSSAGSSIGAMRGVQFGTGSDYEAKGEYLYHFFGIVDRGLKSTLHGAPLLLAGVTEEVAAYRRASRYPHLLESAMAGNGGVVSPLEMIAPAQAAAREHLRRGAASALREYLETPARYKAVHTADQVFAAAVAGRVHCLIGAADLAMEAMPKSHQLPLLMAGEDMINAAAVETIKHGGKVYLLPIAELGGAAPLSAVLRY
jgi:hypothetical protein